MTMKPYLIDVPVIYHVWCRPEIQKKTFEPIRQARPSILFLSSDGGRNEEEWEKIRKSREIVENIDWDCKVYKIYQDKNVGMYTQGRIVKKQVFSLYDRAVEFEDDILVDSSFFGYCAELLERYKDDERIACVCGMNPIGVYDKPSSDYFFYPMVNGWGIGYWKRTFELQGDDRWQKDEYVMRQALELYEKAKKGNRKIIEKRFRSIIETGRYDGHVPGMEFYVSMEFRLQSRLAIYPKYNMCRNIGATDDAAHNIDFKKLDKWSQRTFTTPIYACPQPLKHPAYVIRDMEYTKESKKYFGGKWHAPVGRVITICKRIYYGDGKILWGKFVKRYIKREKEIET